MKRQSKKAESLKNELMGRDLFSYVVDGTLPTVKILQQETGMTLLLELEKGDRGLYVTGYKLSKYRKLGKFFGDLYEAATLDFVLQTVKTLLSLAEKYNVYEIFFILPKDEANYFNDLGVSVLPVTTVMTDKGKRSCFVLFYSPLTVDAIRGKIQDIQSRLKADFWTIKPSILGKETDLKVNRLPYLMAFNKAVSQVLNGDFHFSSEQIH